MASNQQTTGRKRVQSSRLLGSDEPLAKKLRKTGETTAGTSQPRRAATPPSQAPSRASSPPHSTLPRSPTVEVVEDEDAGIETRGPSPRRPNRDLEADDGSDEFSDDDDEDTQRRATRVEKGPSQTTTGQEELGMSTCHYSIIRKLKIVQRSAIQDLQGRHLCSFPPPQVR